MLVALYDGHEPITSKCFDILLTQDWKNRFYMQHKIHTLPKNGLLITESNLRIVQLMTNYLGILFCPSSTTAYSTPGAIVSNFKSANVGRVTTNQLYGNSLLDRLRILGDYTYNSCLLGGSLGTGRCRYSGHRSWNAGCRWYWLAFQAKHCRIVLAGS